MPDTKHKNNDSNPSNALKRNLLCSIGSLVPGLRSVHDIPKPARSDSPSQTTPQPGPSSPPLADEDTIELSEVGNDTNNPPRASYSVHQLAGSNESHNRALTAIESTSSPNDQPAVLSSRDSLTRVRKGDQLHRYLRFKSLGGGGLSNLMATLSLVGMLFFAVRTYILTLWGAQTQSLGTCAAFVQAGYKLGPNCMKRFSNDTMDIMSPPYSPRRRMLDTYQNTGTVVFDSLPVRSSDSALNKKRDRFDDGFYLGMAFLVILSTVAGVLTALLNIRRSRKDQIPALVISPVKLDIPESEQVPETSMDPHPVDGGSEAEKDSEIDSKVTEFLRRKPWYIVTNTDVEDDRTMVKTLDEERRLSISSASSPDITGASEVGEAWDWLPFPPESEDSKGNWDSNDQAIDDRSISSADPTLIGGETGKEQDEDSVLDSSDEKDNPDWTASPEAESRRHRIPTDRMYPDIDKILPPLPGLEGGLEGLIWQAYKYASEVVRVPTTERTRVLDVCYENERKRYPSAESFESDKKKQPLLLISPQTDIKSPHLSRFFLKRRTRQAAGATAQEIVYTAAEGPPGDSGW